MTRLPADLEQKLHALAALEIQLLKSESALANMQHERDLIARKCTTLEELLEQERKSVVESLENISDLETDLAKEQEAVKFLQTRMAESESRLTHAQHEKAQLNQQVATLEEMLGVNEL